MVAILSTAVGLIAPWVRAGLCACSLMFLPVQGLQSNEIINGMQIVEGDIIVARDGDFDTGTRSSWQQRGLGPPSGARVWPNGLVPYYIDETLDAAITRNIGIAVEEWNRIAGITLFPVTRESRPVDYLHFQPGDGCASWVGFLGGAQEVWLSGDCNAGSIMHEIGHALGLEHEHTRRDRDQYIEILWDNIHSEKQHNFNISARDGQLLGDYDYGSIMHYGLTHFSRNGLATIRAVRDTNQSIGQRNLPSIGDISSVARLYASDIAVVTQLDHVDEESEITIYITNDHSQGAHNIVIEVTTGQAALAASYIDDVACQPMDEGATCRLNSLAGGATRIARLAFDGHIEHANIETRLHSKTPDTNIQNNSGGVASEPALARAQQIYSDANTGKVHTGQLGYWLTISLLLLGIGRRALS